MGPAFVLLFWLLIAGIYGVIVLAFAGLFLLSWKKKWKLLKWLSGTLASIMTIVAMLAVAFLAWGIIRACIPTCVFKDTFFVSPPASVSEIQSSCFWFADSGNIYLRFKASEADFKQLIPARLQKKSAAEMKDNTPIDLGSESPGWWDFQIDPDWIYYERIYKSDANATTVNSGQKGFSSETEYYAYNPKNGIVYYRFVGID